MLAASHPFIFFVAARSNMGYYRQGPIRPGGPGMRLGVPGLTPMVRNIMIASAAIWGVQLLALVALKIDLADWFGVQPAAVARGWIWQPVTYMFLHAVDPFHLLFNMLMLWMFGGELERFWGARGFLRYYLVCGVGAGLLAVLAGWLGANPYVTTYGASGAVFGLIAAFGMIFGERVVLFMLLFPMKARTMALILFGLNLFYLLSQPGSGVSYLAHVGGAVVGFLYLKRAWRLGEFYRELRWRFLRRRFKVMPPPDDQDRFIH